MTVNEFGKTRKLLPSFRVLEYVIVSISEYAKHEATSCAGHECDRFGARIRFTCDGQRVGLYDAHEKRPICAAAKSNHRANNASGWVGVWDHAITSRR